MGKFLQKRKWLSLSFVCLVFLAIAFLYNQRIEVAAQEIVCQGPEIPVGKVIDKARGLSFDISGNLQQILAGAATMIIEAEELLPLADECRASRCFSSCQIQSGVCSSTSCQGIPCPTGEIAGTMAVIETAYNQIENGEDEIADLTGGGEVFAIRQLLKQARKGLEECVTPANAYEEELQRFDFLLSCQEGRFQGVFTEEQERCYPNNFFCCSFQSEIE